MAVCDICNKTMEGIHPSMALQKGDSLTLGWQSATHKEITNCRKLVIRALNVHMEKLNISLQISDELIQGWIKEKETLFGQSDWLLCPECVGILKGKVYNVKTISPNSKQTLKVNEENNPLLTYEMQMALYLPETVLRVQTYGVKATLLAEDM